MESTLVMIKPNGVCNGLIGEILSKYEKARLSLSAIQIISPSQDQIEGFYQEHAGKPFFEGLVKFMMSGPVVMMTLSGENAISKVRAINGATDPSKAAPGTIRHDFAPDTTKNVVHASDAPDTAKREINYWFGSQKLVLYDAKSSICQ